MIQTAAARCSTPSSASARNRGGPRSQRIRRNLAMRVATSTLYHQGLASMNGQQSALLHRAAAARHRPPHPDAVRRPRGAPARAGRVAAGAVNTQYTTSRKQAMAFALAWKTTRWPPSPRRSRTHPDHVGERRQRHAERQRPRLAGHGNARPARPADGFWPTPTTATATTSSGRPANRGTASAAHAMRRARRTLYQGDTAHQASCRWDATRARWQRATTARKCP